MDQKESVRDITPWDGTLSSSDFFSAACAFSEKWKRFSASVPPWLWVPSRKHHLLSSHKEEGYLSLEGMCLIKSSEEQESCRSQTWKEESSISQEEEAVDNATLVYGQPLPFGEIEKDLPDHSAKIRSESKWTFITQEEHPYLNRPWYKLHPCGTSEWMKLLFLGDTALNKNGFVIEHYLVSWFSVIGQVVGLKIPLGMLETVSC
ncbi:ubiquitin-like-conjugating enzyme ATG10 isoform X2 [Arachis duranensis]|uniref:Ubiquitin-like-conjugating enzyme ATG10 n=1 Tax=Arachis duranensis TaxID=130453 RepID=A0A6P4C0L8_ARADU|nr:ubiquitin-like-conjugating enzyme ATG10 isoform X2 [Arachis duranensis]